LQILLSDLKFIEFTISNASQALLIYFRFLISLMQKRINIGVSVFFNNFNKYKLKAMFLLEIYSKVILDLKCYEQATIIVQALNKVFIAKSL